MERRETSTANQELAASHVYVQITACLVHQLTLLLVHPSHYLHPSKPKQKSKWQKEVKENVALSGVALAAVDPIVAQEAGAVPARMKRNVTGERFYDGLLCCTL